jgi:hypothetical protein
LFQNKRFFEKISAKFDELQIVSFEILLKHLKLKARIFEDFVDYFLTRNSLDQYCYVFVRTEQEILRSKGPGRLLMKLNEKPKEIILRKKRTLSEVGHHTTKAIMGYSRKEILTKLLKEAEKILSSKNRKYSNSMRIVGKPDPTRLESRNTVDGIWKDISDFRKIAEKKGEQRREFDSFKSKRKNFEDILSSDRKNQNRTHSKKSKRRKLTNNLYEKIENFMGLCAKNELKLKKKKKHKKKKVLSVKIKSRPQSLQSNKTKEKSSAGKKVKKIYKCSKFGKTIPSKLHQMSRGRGKAEGRAVSFMVPGKPQMVRLRNRGNTFAQLHNQNTFRVNSRKVSFQDSSLSLLKFYQEENRGSVRSGWSKSNNSPKKKKSQKQLFVKLSKKVTKKIGLKKQGKLQRKNSIRTRRENSIGSSNFERSNKFCATTGNNVYSRRKYSIGIFPF